MSSKEVDITEEELAGLMAELEGDPVIPSAAAPAVAPEPAPEEIELPSVEEKLASMTVYPKKPAPEERTEVVSPKYDTGVDAAIQEPQRKAGLGCILDVNKFKTETRVSFEDLQSAMMGQNGLRAHYSTIAAHAAAQFARKKAQFEVQEAMLYNEHRKQLEGSGTKTTEKMIESAVKTDPNWLELKEELIDAESIAEIARGLVVSLADRKDMIVQLGADQRSEYRQVGVGAAASVEQRAAAIMRGGQ